MKQNFKNKSIKLCIKIFIPCFLVFYPTECAIASMDNFQTIYLRAEKQLNQINMELNKSIILRVAITEHFMKAQKYSYNPR